MSIWSVAGESKFPSTQTRDKEFGSLVVVVDDAIGGHGRESLEEEHRESRTDPTRTVPAPAASIILQGTESGMKTTNSLNLANGPEKTPSAIVS